MIELWNTQKNSAGKPTPVRQVDCLAGCASLVRAGLVDASRRMTPLTSK